MKSKRRGFTLIEVMLFLAITGLLFAGVIVGVQNSMFQQRYNDSVQSFAEFLRSLYSQTSNVQNSNSKGRSNRAVYGRLVVFGEKKKLNGEPNNDGTVIAYDVVGDADGAFFGDIRSAIQRLNLNVVIESGSTVEYAGNVEEYTPRWGATIQTITPNTTFYGAILVIRHPSSGTIHTLVKTTSNNSDRIYSINNLVNSGSTAANIQALFSNWNGFNIGELDFCINPSGIQNSQSRRNVRMISNARNASGVEVIELDSSDNNCRR